MDTHYIKSIPFYTFCFHPEKLHLFYLKESQETKSFIIVEEDLLTNGIMNTFVIPKEARESSGYHLSYCRKKHYLVLAYPPCQLCIWDTNSSSSLLYTETRGKNPYFINSLTFSELQPIIFFAAIGQRNIYCANVNDAISNGFFVNYTKLKMPKKVHVFDLKTHPVDHKIVAACSDGQLRIWNYNSFTSLKHIVSPTAPTSSQQSSSNNANLNQMMSGSEKMQPAFQCINFSSEGHRLLSGNDQGKIFIWDSRTLGQRNILLAQTRLSEVGIFSLCWIFYNGDFRSDSFLAYTGEGNIKLLTLTMSMQQMREQQQQKKVSSNSKNKPNVSTELLGKITEIGNLQYIKNDIKVQSLQTVNLGLAAFLQAHSYSNLVAFNTVHTKVQLNSQAQGKLSFSYMGKLFLLHDKLYDKIEFPILSHQFTHTLEDLIPKPIVAVTLDGHASSFSKNSNNIEANNQNHQQYTTSLPAAQRLVAFQSQLFYIEGMDIKGFSLARGQIRNIMSLKQILVSEDIKFYNIQFRPLTLAYAERGKFLLSYKLENNFVATIVKTKVEQNASSNIENFKEIPCAQAIFLGAQHLNNPPIFFLHENRTSFSVEIDEEQPFDVETASFLTNATGNSGAPLKSSLAVRIQRVFPTPLKQGFVILYQTMNENLLRFSRNRLESNPNILDYGLLTSEYSFRSEFDETIIDVVWQCLDINFWSDKMQQEPRFIAAVISLSKIYFISDTLSVFYVYRISSQVSSNLVIQAKWFGPTLFYATQTHVHYVTVTGSSNSILSFDNYESKNIIGMIMMDRLLVVQKSNTKKKAAAQQLEFKCKSLSILEPLMLGYLDACSLMQMSPNNDIVKLVIQTFSSHSFSTNLINKFNSLGLFNCSQFLLGLDEAKQFSPYQHMTVMKNVLEANSFTQVLFPQRNPLSDKGDAIEIMKKLQLDPRYSAQKKHLQELQNYYLQIGEYQQAYQCASLLSDYKHILYLGASMNNREFLNQVARQVLNSDTGRFVHQTEYYLLKQLVLSPQQQEENQDQADDHCKNICVEAFSKYNSNGINMSDLGNIQNLNLKQNKQVIREISENGVEGQQLAEKIARASNLEKIEKVKLSFGEQPYKQVYFEKLKDEGEEEEVGGGSDEINLQNIDFLTNENLKSYLGLCNVYESKGSGPQAGSQAGIGGGGGAGGVINVDAGNDFDFGEDNEGKEFQDIVIYWRFDDGKGNHIDDLSNYENHGEITQAQPGSTQLKDDEVWIPTEDGQPMELEDNWGKKCPPQFAIELKQPGQFCITTLKKNWFRDKVRDFTIEVWFKPQDGNGCIFSIGNDNLALELLNYEPVVKIKGEKTDFQPYKDEESDENPTNEEIDRKLKQGVWNHLCLLYEKESARIILIIGCKFQFAAEEKDLPISLFKDTKVVLLPLGRGACGQITEFRFRKLRYSYKEIKDEYRTPLSIVAEKRKKIKVKFKEKGEATTSQPEKQQQQDLKKFKIGQQFGFQLGLPEQVQSQQGGGGGLGGVTGDFEIGNGNGNGTGNFGNNNNQNKFQSQSDNSTFSFKIGMPPAESEEQQQQFGGKGGFEAFNQSKRTDELDDQSKKKKEISNQITEFKQTSSVYQKQVIQQEQDEEEEEKQPKQSQQLQESNFENASSIAKGMADTSGFSNFNTTSAFQGFTTDFRSVSIGLPQNYQFGGFNEEQQQQQMPQPTQQQSEQNKKGFGSWDDFNSFAGGQQQSYQAPKQSNSQSQFGMNSFNDQWGEKSEDSKQQESEKQQGGQTSFSQFGDNFVSKSNNSNNNLDNNENQNVNQDVTKTNTRSTSTIQQSNNQFTSDFGQFGTGITNQQGGKIVMNQDKQLQQEEFPSQVNSKQYQQECKNVQAPLESQFSNPMSQETEQSQKKSNASQNQTDITQTNKLSLQSQAKALQQEEQQQLPKLSSTSSQKPPQQQQTQQKPDSSTQQTVTQKIQSCIDKASDELMNNNIQPAINEINKAFELIKQYIECGNEEKAKVMQKVIQFCATYRFALQLLIGIGQMRQQDYKKKEIFLYLILIYLNIKPNHRVKFIIDAIERSIETSNSILADALVQSLINQLEKVTVPQSELQRLQNCKQKLAEIPEKINQNMNKMTCPYCQKVFHYKGVKKCNKCDKEFLLCYQTLNCLSKETALKCMSCLSIFSPTIKKVNDFCPICRISKLSLNQQ